MAEYLDKVGFKAMWDNAGMIGASSSEDGDKGLVPAPSAGDQIKFLRGDGTWQLVSGGGGGETGVGDYTAIKTGISSTGYVEIDTTAYAKLLIIFHCHWADSSALFDTAYEVSIPAIKQMTTSRTHSIKTTIGSTGSNFLDARMTITASGDTYTLTFSAARSSYAINSIDVYGSPYLEVDGHTVARDVLANEYTNTQIDTMVEAAAESTVFATYLEVETALNASSS